MINNVVLVGRLTKDIDLRKTTSNISTCTFTLACDRRFKSTQEGAATADFIQCVAWRQSADFLAQYATKGAIVAVEGSIQTRNYEGQNGRVYVTEVLAERVRLIGGRPQGSTGVQNNNYNQSYSNQSYSNQTYTPSVEPSFNEEDNFSNTPSLDISSDDLPFY